MKKLVLAMLLLPFFINLTAQTIGDPEVVFSIEEKTLLSPKYSPDGKYISFSGDNYQGLYLFNTSSGKITTITEEPTAGFGASWSSDSKFILARTAKYVNNKRENAVKTFNVETNEANTIIDYQLNLRTMPQWSNSGKSVLIALKSQLNKSAVKGLKDDNSLTIQDENTIIIDGTKLAIYTSGGQLKYIDPVKGSQYLNLAISPDKSLAAFEVYGGDLYVIKTDGSNLVDLGKGERPAWSSDSKYIAYGITKDDGQQFTSSEIYKVKSDGSDKVQLINNTDIIAMNPCWSPDSKKIIFNDAKSGAIYSITLSN